MSRRRARRGFLTALAATASACALAPASQAASIQISSETVLYSDGANETNNVSVARTATDYVVSDSVPITVGAGCVNVVANVATCPAADISDLSFGLGGQSDTFTADGTLTPIGQSFSTDLTVQGDSGNDVITGGPNVQNELYGHISFDDGPGTDTLTGGLLRDELFGSDDADLITGGDEGDSLNPGAGADTVNGGPGQDRVSESSFGGGQTADGPDTINGGPGEDLFSYSSRLAPVNVTLDGAPNDGEGCPGPGCEGDNIGADVEDLDGGAGNDFLVGNASRNEFGGGAGDDVLNAAGGTDEIFGGDGNDILRGGAGDDVNLNGGEDEDLVLGGAGDDSLESIFATDDSDDLRGGQGIDIVDYSGASGAVKVDLDNKPDDGVEGENDNVRADVEDVIGTEEDDVLIGSKRPNELDGGGGNDRIVGGEGADGLLGGRGRDRLVGGKGADLIDGDAGPDQISARDGGPDQVFCGSSADRVTADRSDRLAADCDNVKRSGRVR